MCGAREAEAEGVSAVRKETASAVGLEGVWLLKMTNAGRPSLQHPQPAEEGVWLPEMTNAGRPSLKHPQPAEEGV